MISYTGKFTTSHWIKAHCLCVTVGELRSALCMTWSVLRCFLDVHTINAPAAFGWCMINAPVAFAWCTINAPVAFAWCTINAPEGFAWYTNDFVHKVEFSCRGWNVVHPLCVESMVFVVKSSTAVPFEIGTHLSDHPPFCQHRHSQGTCWHLEANLQWLLQLH